MGYIEIFLLLTVSGESCTTLSDCHNTQCADGHNPLCEFPTGGSEGLCTCATTEGRLPWLFFTLISKCGFTAVSFVHSFDYLLILFI